MKVNLKIAIYEDGDIVFCERESKVIYYIRNGWKIAEVEIDYDKLPKPMPVFGKGIVINEKK